MSEQHPPTHQEGPGYETRDASIPWIIKVAAGTLATIAFAFLAMYGLFKVFERMPATESKATDMEMQQVTNPGPMLQIDNTVDLRTLRAQEEERLHSYGMDSRSGVVRLPIERAMELVAERGVPVWKAPPAPQGEKKQ